MHVSCTSLFLPSLFILFYFINFLLQQKKLVHFISFHLFGFINNVQIGAVLNSLEDLKEINLGQLSFSLPDNLDELQNSLGGEGACVQVGYSLISTTKDQGFFFLFPPCFPFKMTFQQYRSPNCIFGVFFSQLPKWNLVFVFYPCFIRISLFKIIIFVFCFFVFSLLGRKFLSPSQIVL